MRLLHTADLHIGKRLHGIDRLPEQRAALRALLDLAEERRPHAVLLAGDLYDRSVPPQDAVSVMSDFLETMVLDLGIPVVGIAGNHDSGERVGFGSRVLRNRGLHLFGPADSPGVVTLEDEHGPVDIVAIPYGAPEAVRASSEAENTVQGHASALVWQRDRAILNLGRPMHARRVAVAHAFVVGGEESESERSLTVGGTGAVPATAFQEFSYTALGHLHRPQFVGWPEEKQRVRYSGSLLAYSFSEVAASNTDTLDGPPTWSSPKSITEVQLDAVGNVSFEFHTLPSPTGLRILEGTLEELVRRSQWESIHAPERAGDLIMARLMDTRPVFDAMTRLRQCWPNTAHIERTGLLNALPQTQGTPSENARRLAPFDLFEDFVEQMRGSDQPISEQELAWLKPSFDAFRDDQ